MPSHDITFCVPREHQCMTTECERHESKAPVGVVLSWADFWNTCSNKTEKPKQYNVYPTYAKSILGTK